jgi:protein TonB
MSDIDLYSRRWLALMFEGKNQEYGAYVNRDESSDRHIKALAIITIFLASILFLPGLIESVIPEPSEIIVQDMEVRLVEVNLEEQVPEENIIRQIEVPPPPELRATLAFTAPVITADENIRDDDLILTQQELSESRAEISIITIEGGDEGINIADLAQQSVIIEEVVDTNAPIQIYEHVEEPASFPGGEAALHKWLSDNLDYPTIAAEQGISGRVALRFVVAPDGTVGSIEVLRSVDVSLDREAIRVVSRMPRWIPGRQNGVPVHVYFNLPVFFRLDNR